MDKTYIAFTVLGAVVFLHVFDRFERIRIRKKKINKLRDECLDEIKAECHYDLINQKPIWHQNYYCLQDSYCRIKEMYRLNKSTYLLILYKREETETKVPIEMTLEEMTPEKAKAFIERHRIRNWHSLKNYLCKREEGI